MGYGIVLAFQFLTRVPFTLNCPWNEKTVKWALRSFPLVGIVIGVILNELFLLDQYVASWMTALLLLTIWVGYTGGLHLDGLMDVSDAIGSNAPLEKRLIIMKDPHVGSFAVLALLFLLGWKFGLLYEFSKSNRQLLPLLPITFILVPALARFGALVLMFFLPTIKKSGLAWEWKKHLTFVDLFISLLPVIIIISFYPFLLFFFLAYVLFLFLFMMWAISMFKGINGDLIGTAIEGGELWLLMIIWIFISFAMA
jgi:adenosylcobinamide-GDP ribazoletransferase